MFDGPDSATSSAPTGTAGELVSSCVQAALTAVSVAAGLPVDGLDGPQLRELCLGLERLRRVLDATQVHALGELDRRRHTDIRCGASTSKWLAAQASLPMGVARRRLALARRLSDDPALEPVADALARGAVGADHARVLAGAVNERNSHALAPVMADLLEAAPAMVFDVWKAHVEHLASMADPDGSHDPDGDLLANKLRLSRSNDFMLVRGELVGEHAVCVADALNAVADELFHQFTRDAENSGGATAVPSRSTLMALALEEVCRRALATDASSTSKPKVEATLVLHASNDRSGVDGTREGSAHLDIWGLHHHLLGPLPASRVPTFLCDAGFHAVVLDSLGRPTDAGREVRHPSTAQRWSLLARDGCCTFPGCDAHLGWLDAHHVRHWAHGGTTDTDNLVVLCRRHHRVAHRSGWSLELDADGWTRWTAPDGHTFFGQRHHHRRDHQMAHNPTTRAGPSLE